MSFICKATTAFTEEEALVQKILQNFDSQKDPMSIVFCFQIRRKHFQSCPFKSQLALGSVRLNFTFFLAGQVYFVFSLKGVLSVQLHQVRWQVSLDLPPPKNYRNPKCTSQTQASSRGVIPITIVQVPYVSDERLTLPQSVQDSSLHLFPTTHYKE